MAHAASLDADANLIGTGILQRPANLSEDSRFADFNCSVCCAHFCTPSFYALPRSKLIVNSPVTKTGLSEESIGGAPFARLTRAPGGEEERDLQKHRAATHLPHRPKTNLKAAGFVPMRSVELTLQRVAQMAPFENGMKVALRRLLWWVATGRSIDYAGRV
jgi:hypothetical protein